MPNQISAKNVGMTTIPAGYLAQAKDDDIELASEGGRPLGLAADPIGAGATGALHPNGPSRSAWLAPGFSVLVGERLVSAGGGLLRPMPGGWTGWIVGKTSEAKTAGGTPAAITISLAPIL